MAPFASSLRVKEAHKNRVQRVGVELEGAWITPPKDWEGDRSPLQRDGSLDEFTRFLTDAGVIPFQNTHRPTHVGEIASHVMSPSEMEAWVTQFYPQRVDHPKCGLHIHMSFGSDVDKYVRLCDPRFPPTIVQYIREWAFKEGLPPDHPLWERLDGRNIYCQHVYDPEGQMLNTIKDYDQRRPGHRYTVINYCHGKTGTIECRLLTMMPTAAQAVSALKEILRVTNGFLLTTAGRTPKFQVDIPIDMRGIIEERTVYI